MNPFPAPLHRSALLWLSLLLLLGGLFFTGSSLFLVVRGEAMRGIVVLAVALLMIAAGIGLYHRKRWGVGIFGLLAVVGSINHLANTLLTFADLSQAGVSTVLFALLAVIAAILIPMGLLYLTFLLWRRMD